MANKYLALKGEKFDISKVTVVGNPTITSDGVASGFSSENYIKTILSNWDLTQHTYDIELYLPNTQGGASNFPFEIFGLWLNLDANRPAVQGWDGSSNPFFTRTTNAFNNGDNVKLKIRYAYNDFRIQMSVNGGEYGGYSQHITNPDKTSNTSTNVLIGSNGGARVYSGSIDLTQFKIYVDGQLVSQPVKPTYLLERRKGYDPSKFTVVGFPTITEDGVASGFSVNDYLTANVNINSSDFDIDFEFTLPNVSSGGQFAFRFNNSSSTRFVVSNAKILMYDNTNLALCSYTYTNNYNAGDLIKAKLKATSSGITLNLLNKTKNTTVTVSSSKVQNIEASLITFGKSATTVATDIFTGSINLPSISIIVEGKEVLTGAKENFYMLRR